MAYRVTHKWITRREDGERVRYEDGDTFDPTDAELSAFGDRLEEAPTPSQPQGSTSESSETDLDAMSYSELQAKAREYDDISGRQSEETLREALAEKEG